MNQPPGSDPFELLKALWGPMGMPMAGMITPAPDVTEIEKRIVDLKSVESWLNMNLSVLRMNIQGLEMQKATLTAMQEMQRNVAGAGPVGQASANAPQDQGGETPESKHGK
jgi:hypothetical protein